MSDLDESVAQVLGTFRGFDDVRAVVPLVARRATLDLGDLGPAEQARLVAARVSAADPSEDALAQRLAAGRTLTVKFVVEPFATTFHLGNLVPLLVLNRLSRMGHRIVFVVGDLSAAFGDPSGSVPLSATPSAAELERNISAYREHTARFLTGTPTEFVRNSDWLSRATLPELMALAAHVPAAMVPGLGDGTLSRALYPVTKAMDAVHTRADIEVGGVYQAGNLAVCRRIMAGEGLDPVIALTTPLIPGVDGAPVMSATRGNEVSLLATPAAAFDRLAAVPADLAEVYLRALTEWQDPEIDRARAVLTPGELVLLTATAVTATLHGHESALRALDSRSPRPRTGAAQ
ncbi:tyrosine--tRNA ligase [Lentzea sp. NPDC059081]|uniref:tyrosine--tRNA ligase n=1 Tax=Lentzea sp. NPDC059081 TaxID=3346719 RepID=UPI00369C37C2